MAWAIKMKDLEICQEILFGQRLSEFPPLFNKRGAGGISGKAVAQGKILAVYGGFANLRIASEKGSVTFFSNLAACWNPAMLE
jgi:hypothetical protein